MSRDADKLHLMVRDGSGTMDAGVDGFRRKWSRKRLVAIGAPVAAVVTALAIIVPIAVAAADKATTHDTVDVNTRYSSDDSDDLHVEGSDGVKVEQDWLIEPVAAGLSTTTGSTASSAHLIKSDWYAVPVDAPWSELWAMPGACVAETFEWLDLHGKPVLPQEISSTITNAATTGAVATVSDIRPQGALTIPPVDTVKVGAMSCSGAAAEGIYATMALGVDPVAMYHECYSPTALYGCAGSAEVLPIVGDPVVFDVAPGETRTLHLVWTQTTDFVGRFVADLTVNGSTSVIDLSPDGADIAVPAVTRPDDVLYFGIDGPWCQSASGPRVDVCGLDTWVAITAAG